MQKYKIGIYNHNHDKKKWIYSCTCGTVGLLDNQSTNYACEGCGNSRFIYRGVHTRETYPYIDIIDKSKKGFKAKRTNLSLTVDKEYNVMVKPNMVQVLLYDLANHKIRLWKKGKEVALSNNKYLKHDRNFQRFFQGVNEEQFINMISVDGVSAMYDMAWKDLSRGNNWNSERRLYRGLPRLFDYIYLEILANAGFPNVNRFKESRGSRWYTPRINVEGKSPKEIIQLPKFCLKYIREDDSIGLYEIEQMQQALKKVDGNRFRELLEIVKDEASIRDLCNALDTLVEIHDTYKYNNIKKLTLYLFREIRMTQGIMKASTGATLLRDYIKMATKLGQDYEKYPKSLKKEHDITQMNYKVKENELKQKEFKEAVESERYKYYEYKKKDYSIISPSEMDDLIKEGNELSHCVASYVDSITAKRCNIYFMRNTEDLNKPLATIEVRGDNVRQARGYANRALKQEERDFVAEWAKKKELNLNYYY